MGSNKPTWEHEREEELASPKYVGAVTLGWGEVFLLNLCFDDWKICICEVGVEERRCRKRRDLEGLLLSSCWGVFANICLSIHFCMDIRLQGLINPNGLEYLTKKIIIVIINLSGCSCGKAVHFSCSQLSDTYSLWKPNTSKLPKGCPVWQKSNQ